MKFFKFVISTFVAFIIIFTLCIYGILCVPKGTFYKSYMSVIQDKFDILLKTDTPKIIVVGGSNCAFGINQKMLEDASGYKVVNLGLHAGFGHLFYSELAKANINEGDIVLLAYEYNWTEKDAFTQLGADLVMSGIDDNIWMYRYIPIDKWPQLLGYIFSYANTKNKADFDTEGVYSRKAFDPVTMQMTILREEELDYCPEKNGILDVSEAVISEETVNYLIEYKRFVEEKGASIYFVAVPVVDESIACDASDFEKLVNMEEEIIGIDYISNPSDYFLPKNLFVDTKYHCNTKGEKIRTEILIEDLKRASIISR